MYEGAFRILRALGDGRSRSRDEVVHDAGEATSVVREVFERYPKWFDETEGRVRCSERGLAALGRELVARGAQAPATSDWRPVYEAMAAERGTPKRALDQVYVTTDTAVRRAELLLGAGEHQRGLVFLGDDDLTSAAVQLAGAGRKVTVLDTDEEITYQLLGPEESDVKNGSISVLSPLGKSLIGKEVGDEVMAQTPGGKREFEVMHISASETS